MKTSKQLKIKAKDFDKKFDAKEDLAPYMDMGSIRANYPVQRINIDVPREMLLKVDQEAARIGVPRTSLIKVWIAEHTDRLAS